MDKRYNTGNPRPSNSMKDLNDNALAYDDFLNSESDTFIDRFGNAQDTMIGATKKMAAATDAVIDEARQNLIPLSKQYMTLADAQADIANIPEGSTTYYRSPDDSALAIEVINNSGALSATGRVMPSQGYVDRVINTSTANENIVITLDADASPVEVRDDFGGVNIPGVPAPVQDILQQVQKSAAPAILRLTDAENAAYTSVDEYGDIYAPEMPSSIQRLLLAMKKDVDKLRKQGMILDARDCGLNTKTGEDSQRAIQRGYNWLSGNGGGHLYVPAGYFKMAIPVVPRSGVALHGAGIGATNFLPYGYLSAFEYVGDETYIENLQFTDFTIDGENQQLHPTRGYIPNIKGILLQYYRNTVFDRIKIQNTGATGLGTDMPDNVSIMRVVTENCGRLGVVGDLGASGIGLGTGFLNSEPIFVYQTVNKHNKNYGIFYEPQRGVGVARDTIAVGNVCEYNHAGMADCGIDGLIAIGNNLRFNEYGFKGSPGTNGAGNPGNRGILKDNHINGNTKHGIYLYTDKGLAIEGEYNYSGNRIADNELDGIHVEYVHTSAKLLNSKFADNEIYRNGRHGFNFVSGNLVNVDIMNNRLWNNGRTEVGDAIAGAADMMKCGITGNKIRDTQDAATQQYPVNLSGALTDMDISFNHCVGNARNTLNLTGAQTRVTTLNNPGIA
ncbi:TPA: right-handed parallel beta-helix repeat-containing protein [Klebsiella quasipneumoniae]|nr:right-handed parallel beta-helix repeat-containing protein [Klebsiella quasipneumoniae]HDE1085228.1 right-handed parallel beta-helix repeat-containing protein [Klebsiella quasipneumoniae]HDE1938179.1 right-handed parallel beta-helix repeat-containing protein [Klebsiella quasipneumoniae]HDE2006751.1 right-handed parallel beta-helix repeat-containing protein [Klebsiella quasipneumoniae]HDE2020958.1 right-handed parallel beta-helix repeat-containing protein [Klebsiella quasipneumoniae]